ncbi:hypothetical protein HRbin30_02648 [bacterium HR30]|nr:hypothetical protein HRbin30_02648 [bacterium HR30]
MILLLQCQKSCRCLYPLNLGTLNPVQPAWPPEKSGESAGHHGRVSPNDRAGRLDPLDRRLAFPSRAAETEKRPPAWASTFPAYLAAATRTQKATMPRRTTRKNPCGLLPGE